MPGSTHHQVLIVGGGTAGITVSAILKRRAVGINLAIVEPEHDHYYQPAFTLVGAGVYPLARTRRAEESLIPVGVDQSDRPALDVLELHVEGARVVPQAQHRLQGRCRLTGRAGGVFWSFAWCRRPGERIKIEARLSRPRWGSMLA